MFDTPESNLVGPVDRGSAYSLIKALMCIFASDGRSGPLSGLRCICAG